MRMLSDAFAEFCKMNGVTSLPKEMLRKAQIVFPLFIIIITEKENLVSISDRLVKYIHV